MFNIEKTQEEIVKSEMEKIISISNVGLNNLAQANKRAYVLFWKNPKVSPQEFCDLMGNEAHKLFQTSADSQTFIKTMRPEHEVLTLPDDYDVEFNQDGTVSITKQEVIEEPLEEVEEEVL